MMQPELEVLLACGRLRLQSADRQRAQEAVARGVDWSALVALAERHGFVPLLYRHVANGDLAMPDDAAVVLRERAAANTRRSLTLTAELVSLIRCFDEAGLPVLPLKGPLLAHQVYGSVGLRQMRDLDLLFRAGDLPHVRDILTARGYAVHMEPAGPSTVTRQSKHHVTAIARERGVTLEIHYELLSHGGRQRWTFERLAPRLRETVFMDRTVRTLSPEDQFAYLCTHGAGHAWSRLEWLTTAAELARSGQLHADALADSIAAFDARRKVNAALRLALDVLHLDTPIPSTNDRWIRAANRSVAARLRREPARIRETRTEKLVYRFLTDADASARLHRARVALTVANADDADVVDPAGRLGMLARPVGLLMRYVFRLRDRGSRGPHVQPRIQ